MGLKKIKNKTKSENCFPYSKECASTTKMKSTKKNKKDSLHELQEPMNSLLE